MEFSRSRYIAQLEKMKWNGLIKVVTGTRRAGKSYLLNQLFYNSLISEGVPEKNIIRFSFDADQDIDLLDFFSENENVRIPDSRMDYMINAKVFRRYLSSCIESDEERYYIILDEVQYLQSFVGTLNSYLRYKNVDLYVTGSNSKFLSVDIATEFKGRSCELHVLPLVFSEVCEHQQETVYNTWAQYITYGGIPLVASMSDEDQKISYLKNLSEEVYLKDIIKRNGIRKKEEFADVFGVLASLISCQVNPTNISNTFKSKGYGTISHETVSRFVSYLSDAFVLSTVKPYNIKGRKLIGSPYKVYFEDIGVRNAVLNFQQVEESHILENVLYNELRYRGFNVSVGKIGIYEKTGKKDKNNHDIYAPKSLEVDFIASKGSQKYYIQSALQMATPEKMQQEKKSLRYIDDSFKKIIVTKNGLNLLRDERGIITLDVFSFLLNEDVLELC